MNKAILKISSIVLALFALITLFMSGSVIFDLFGIREKEGNYVLFVVISNFIAGFLYLSAVYGLLTQKKWTTSVLLFTTIILTASFIGLLIHAYTGGLYEQKTIKAMLFRISITGLYTIISWFYISKNNKYE